MPRSGPWWKRWWVALGLLLACGGGVGLAWAWWNRDPWPARVVIPYPADQAVMLAPRFSPDGKSLSISRPGGVETWDVATGERRQPTARPLILAPVIANNRSPVVTRDRQSFVGIVEPSPQDQEVVWADAASGAIRARFPVGAGRVEHLAFGPDDRSVRAVVVAADRTTAEVATWDLASGNATRRPVTGWPLQTRTSTISPDGRLLAYVNPTQIGLLLWDLDADHAQGDLIGTQTTQVHYNVSPVFSADGQTLYIPRVDDQVECWDVPGARLLRTLTIPIQDQALFTLTLAPDGQTLAAGLINVRPARLVARAWDEIRRFCSNSSAPIRSELILLDSTSGQILIRHEGSHEAMFAPDGRSVATFEMDGTISIRDLPRAAQ